MKHQAEAMTRAHEPRLLVEAPTGAGKTWTAAAPLLDAVLRGESAIFVYPTNALADDQEESLVALATAAGLRAAVVGKDAGVSVLRPDVIVWRVHAAAIHAAQRALHARTRGETLAEILENLPSCPLWLVTNPDTLFLLCTARYARSPRLWNYLSSCQTLVLDEFHLYRGPALVRALALIELTELLLDIRRVRVLSATVPASTRALLTGGLGFGSITARAAEDGRIVQDEVDLHVRVASTREATDAVAQSVHAIIETLRAERMAVGTGGTVPLVVLRQSVLAAAGLEDALHQHGIAYDEIGVYRGLSSRAIRSMNGKTLVIGTSALEVGVDFKTRRLIFEALSGTSFVQRFGRVGRHSPGTATFYTSARVSAALDSLGDQCSRDALLAASEAALALDDDLSGFWASGWGRLVAEAAVGALQKYGSEHGATEQFAKRVDQALGALLRALGQPGTIHVSRKVRRRLENTVGFRGGTGSVEVFDVREKQRRGDATLAIYELELPTFYKRAQWNPSAKPGRRPVVVGYGPPLAVDLCLSGAAFPGPVPAGLYAPAPDEIELRVEGRATTWERLLAAREHTVGWFPRRLREMLSWREEVFGARDSMIALLDDDALVGAYWWDRISGP